MKTEEEQKVREEKRAEEKRKILQELEHKKFWHYCEVCGKKELLTPDEAYEQGWDYPPRMGIWGVLGPRTCGNCGIADTVYMKIAGGKKMSELNEKEREVVGRIIREPYSVLKDEDAAEYRKRMKGEI